MQQTFLPTGPGATSAWTAVGAANLWDCVNDPIGSPDDDTTYGEEFQTNGDALFTFDTPAIPAGSTINFVAVTSRHRRGAAGTNWTRRAVVRVGGSNFFSGTGTVSSQSYVDTATQFTTNPATGLAWTVDQVNGIGTSELQQFGLSVTGNTSADDTARITQIYLTIDYTPPAGTVFLLAP